MCTSMWDASWPSWPWRLQQPPKNKDDFKQVDGLDKEDFHGALYQIRSLYLHVKSKYIKSDTSDESAAPKTHK